MNRLTIYFIVALSLIGGSQLKSENIIDRILLQEDARQLVEILETSHPDPYLKMGGKISFHQKFHKIMESIPTEGMTKQEFYRLLNPFVTSIGDAHTLLWVPYIDDKWAPGGVPLEFHVIEQSLYVSGVVDESLIYLIGARLSSVENIHLPELIKRQNAIRASENIYGTLSLLGHTTLWYGPRLSDLIPEWKDETQIKIGFELSDGSLKELLLPIPDLITDPIIRAETSIKIPSIEKCDFVYDFIDNEKQTAYLRIADMSSYRENFENRGISENLFAVKSIYFRYNGVQGPNNTDSLLAGLPSVTETFRNLVVAMKKAQSNTLIVDLRGNGGGNSVMAKILLYFLFGKESMLASGGESSEIIKYSKFYFEKFRNADLEKINQNHVFPLNELDYDLKYDYTIDPGKRNKYDVSEMYRSWFATMPTFYNEYISEEFSGYYRPKKIVVLCSATTFSSAYVLMVNLYNRGAVIVGTPSSQAGNFFGEILSFKLHSSELKGWVSCKYFSYFPNDPEKARVLNPHYQLTYEKLTALHYDPNAELILALEKLPEMDKLK
jgi:hypothetical protein